MKRFWLVTAVLAVLVVGVGFYRGWFTLTGGREAESDNIDVKLSVDTDKVKDDAASFTRDSKTEDSNNE